MVIMALSKKKKLAVKHRNIGIEAKAPQEVCSDSKCPWHGTLPVRGRVFVGNVKAASVGKLAVIEWTRYHYITKYQRYERRNTRIVAYNPLCINAKANERIKIAECRPLSKTKSFVVVERL